GRHFSFEPAEQDGVPVAAKVRAIVRFVGVPAPAPPAKQPEAPPPPPAVKAAAVAPPPAARTPEATTAVDVRGERPLTRTASETVVERPVLQAAPHRTAGDLVLTVPGLYITQHSGEGKAYQIFYRGFDAVHGQDLEIWAGGAPVNDVSNIHGQGYADLH